MIIHNSYFIDSNILNHVTSDFDYFSYRAHSHITKFISIKGQRYVVKDNDSTSIIFFNIKNQNVDQIFLMSLKSNHFVLDRIFDK